MGKSVSRMVALAILTAVALCSCSAFNLKKRTVKVEGMSSIEVDGDIAVVSLAVRESGASVKEVQQAGNAKVNSIVSAAGKCGISSDSIKTVSFRIYPAYEYSEDGERRRKGQEYYHSLEIEIKDFKHEGGLDALSGFLDSLRNIEAIEVNDISYRLSDSMEWVSRARVEAVENGLTKCNDYAKGAGMRVSRVSSIFENYSTFTLSGDSEGSGFGESAWGSGSDGFGSSDYGNDTRIRGGKVLVRASVSIEAEIE